MQRPATTRATTRGDRTTLGSTFQHRLDLSLTVDMAAESLAYANPAARELLGLTSTPTSLFDVIDLEQIDRLMVEAVPRLRAGETWSGDLRLRSADGATVAVQALLTAEVDGEKLERITIIGRDITTELHALSDLAHRATHDPLTDLPNRSLLEDRIQQALARSSRRDDPVAVIFIDLDGFKQINDAQGHAAGDRILIQTAHAVSSVLRPSDTVARLGGDEFVIVCDVVADATHAVAIAARINEAIADLAVESLTASTGIALSSSPEMQPSDLLRLADTAMYKAKALGPGRVEVFDDAMREREIADTQLTARLDDALDADELAMHVQPIINLRSGATIGVEAFVRMRGPDDSIVSAASLLSVAGRRLIAIDRWMFGQACGLAGRWRNDHATAPRIHVNFATETLGDPDLLTFVREQLDDHALDPTAVALEFNESSLMTASSAAVDNLRGLGDAGVLVVVDDYGTAHSSIAQLHALPTRMLKIDVSLIESLGRSPDADAIVSASLRMSSSLGMVAVAEGVETAEQVRSLAAMGCPAAQGVYFTSPAEPDSIEPYLSKTLDIGFW